MKKANVIRVKGDKVYLHYDNQDREKPLLIPKGMDVELGDVVYIGFCGQEPVIQSIFGGNQ